MDFVPQITVNNANLSVSTDLSDLRRLGCEFRSLRSRPESADRFSDMVRELEGEHYREVAQLRAERDVLQKRIRDLLPSPPPLLRQTDGDDELASMGDQISLPPNALPTSPPPPNVGCAPLHQRKGSRRSTADSALLGDLFRAQGRHNTLSGGELFRNPERNASLQSVPGGELFRNPERHASIQSVQGPDFLRALEKPSVGVPGQPLSEADEELLPANELEQQQDDEQPGIPVGIDQSNARTETGATDWTPFPTRPVWADLEPSDLHTMLQGSLGEGDAPQTPAHLTRQSIVVDKRHMSFYVQPEKTGLDRWVRSPGSPTCVAWDLIGGMLILYDLIVIPLRVFDPLDNPFTTVVDWFTLLYWTFHMVHTCFTGVHHRGEIVMRVKDIVKIYLRTWFVVDAVVVFPSWIFHLIELATDSASNGTAAVKLVRVTRLARIIRLLRLLRLSWIMAVINDLFDSEACAIIADIVKMIVLLLGYNHCIACVWFWLGTASELDQDRQTWVKYHHYDNSPWEYQYFTSMHWAITQFTPASMDVQPVNSVERVFTITVVVFALVGFSYLLGSISSSISQLRGMKEEEAKEFWKLRRYLKMNNVSSELGLRIRRYVEHEYHRNCTGSTSRTVKLLDYLSEQLQRELQCALNVPHLKVHPLFTFVGQASEVTVQRMATLAISAKHFARADAIFYPTEIATSCYFVVSGRLQYMRMDLQGYEKKEWVDQNEDWISEPVLWTARWVHLGVLIAIQLHNHLLAVDATRFAEVVLLTPVARYIVRNYAKNFLEWLNSVPYKDLSDIIQGDEVSDEVEEFIFKGDDSIQSMFHRTQLQKQMMFGKASRSTSNLSDFE